MSAICRRIIPDPPIRHLDRLQKPCVGAVLPNLGKLTVACRQVVPQSIVLAEAESGDRWVRRRASVVRFCLTRDGGEAAQDEKKRLRLEGGSSSDRGKRAEVAVAVAVTVLLAVGNRVLYKLALVPLKNYPFFLAQFATFGYVVVYFSILYFRYHAGIVTDEMLSLPKSRYLAVGLLEALAAASGMAAGDKVKRFHGMCMPSLCKLVGRMEGFAIL